MFRPLALAVALMLAAAPEMSSVCKFWCASRDMATQTCHHQQGALIRVTYDRSCSEASLDVANFVKQELQRLAGPSSECSNVSPRWHPFPAEHDRIVANDRNQTAFLGFVIPGVLRI